MHVSEDVLCVYSGQVIERNGSYVIEVPEQEVSHGAVEEDTGYRIAIFAAQSDEATEQGDTQTTNRDGPTPPVAVGDERTVDIEDIGEQGDGIARVERGYVVIVQETEKGERVTVKITDVRENLAFAEVIDREDYYE